MEKMSLQDRAGQKRPPPDYSRWSYEELKRFAVQLRVPDASVKSRR